MADEIEGTFEKLKAVVKKVIYDGKDLGDSYNSSWTLVTYEVFSSII